MSRTAWCSFALVLFTSSSAWGGSTTLLITQVQTRGSVPGGVGLNSGNDESIVLYNQTSSPISLSGWRLEARGSAASLYTSRWTGGVGQTIPAWGYFLLGGSSYDGAAAPDDVFGLGISDASAIRLKDPTGTVIDVVVFYYNAATLADVTSPGYTLEGTPVSNLPHNDLNVPAANVDVGLQRRFSPVRGYYQDTDDNAADFESAATSVYLNTQTPPEPDTDGDGFVDPLDNCFDVANADQTDTDADGLGNACDASPYDSVEALCPCDGGWASHDEYVQCVAAETNALKAAGEISGRQKGAIQSAAARSICGG
jgi:hypothetical protein